MKTQGPMTLHQCEQLAKDQCFDGMKFTAMFPAGPRVCKWLDAYFGMFTIEGVTDGSFVMVRQVDDQFPDLVCIPHTEEESEAA